MTISYKLGLCVAFCLLLLACPKAVKTPEQTPLSDDQVFATDAGNELTVTVKSENVRQKPNGKRLGSLRKGAELTVLKRVGNWIHFTSPKFEKAYIWAPSVGYAYQNIYSPFFFFDSTRTEFREVEWFQKMFSQRGQVRQETSTNYELFFKDTGLGSHEETVLDVVATSDQVVEHGITLFVNKEGSRVEKVRVDFYRPVKGYQAALKKGEMKADGPGDAGSGHIIWAAGDLLDHLIVDLERKEWESNYFSSVWYMLPEKQ